jgi:pyrimidine operon attenuation protein/uracil phosphoribosyltransferase
MGDFVLDGKSKVKRIFPAVEEKLAGTGRVTLVGVQNGAVKAVALAEKLKQKSGNLTQVNEISQKDNLAVITITLTIPESRNMDLGT